MNRDRAPDLFGEGDVHADQLPAWRPSKTTARLITNGIEIAAQTDPDILFQHAVLCQTCLPYRDPGDGVIEWERRQGRTILAIEARKTLDPETHERVRMGLPFGPKPRLILAHLNTQALRTRSNVVEVADSLTAFARTMLGFSPNGHEVRVFKLQLAKLAAADFTFHRIVDDVDGRVGSQNTYARVMKSHDLWLTKDERQRVLWTSTVALDPVYFEDLQRHAVPLNQLALAGLAHNAMALDIYAWLAYRLHRVPHGKPQFVPWTAVKDQFGWQYARIRKFREVFRVSLRAVASQYPEARVTDDERGLTLHHSKPPIGRRLIAITSCG